MVVTASRHQAWRMASTAVSLRGHGRAHIAFAGVLTSTERLRFARFTACCRSVTSPRVRAILSRGTGPSLFRFIFVRITSGADRPCNSVFIRIRTMLRYPFSTACSSVAIASSAAEKRQHARAQDDVCCVAQMVARSTCREPRTTLCRWRWANGNASDSLLSHRFPYSFCRHGGLTAKETPEADATQTSLLAQQLREPRTK
jgi:hypothetical protein